MEGFQQGANSQRTKIIINLFTCCITLYFAVQRGSVIREQSPFESWVIDLIAPIQKSITNTSDNLKNAYRDYFLNVGAMKKVKKLRNENIDSRLNSRDSLCISY